MKGSAVRIRASAPRKAPANHGTYWRIEARAGQLAGDGTLRRVDRVLGKTASPLDPRGQPLLPGSHLVLHGPIRIDGDWSGSVNPGMLEGETATAIPRATRASATKRVSRRPCGKTFSAKIIPATIAIQNTFITPSANSTAIRPKQQPTQSRPFARPVRRAPRLSEWSGLRQRRSKRFLSGVSS